MINAGKYNRKIGIYAIEKQKDEDGFTTDVETLVANVWAEVKTTQGFTLIASNSDFEDAVTRFTVRYRRDIESAYLSNNRKMIIKHANKRYTVEYFNNINEANTEIELQCKAVTK